MANVNAVAQAAMRRHVHNANSLGYRRTVYYPVGGDSKYVDAIVDFGEGYRDQNESDGVTLMQATQIQVDPTDCPNLRTDDKFRIDGVEYFLSGVPQVNDLGLTSVALTRMTHTEKSAGGTRKQGR